MSSSQTLLTALHDWLSDSSPERARGVELHTALTLALERVSSGRKRPLEYDALACSHSITLRSSNGLTRSNIPIPVASVAPGGRGELVLIGSGLKAMCHLTREAMGHLRAADLVFGALQPGGPDRRWLEIALGRTVVDLNQFYPTDASADRRAAYIQGTEAVLREICKGRRCCVVEYGHPTVAAQQSELLLREARRLGYPTVVLPGISCVDALWADLGLDPAPGCLVATADSLLESAPLRDAIGRGLPHLVLLMPDAVGDAGSGADLASGSQSLADAPAWHELLGLLQRKYGLAARCVLYRAPLWASMTRPCMLSVPIASLACRSCVDGLIAAWGGDLGTMYLAGEQSDDGGAGAAAVGGAGGAGASSVGGSGDVGGATGGNADVTATTADHAASMIAIAAATRWTAATAGALDAPAAPSMFASAPAPMQGSSSDAGGFDDERQSWLKRWAIFDVPSSYHFEERVHTHLGPVCPRECVPPRSTFATEAPSRATAGFSPTDLSRLREAATPMEARIHGESHDINCYLETRAAYEPSDRAIQLQLAFAACARTDAPATVSELAVRLDEAIARTQSGPEVGCGPGSWIQLAQSVLKGSELYGQLGLPCTDAAIALWDMPASSHQTLQQ